MDDLVAVLDAVECQQAVVFGTNEGGPLAIMFKALHPERANYRVGAAGLVRPPQSQLTTIRSGSRRTCIDDLWTPPSPTTGLGEASGRSCRPILRRTYSLWNGAAAWNDNRRARQRPERSTRRSSRWTSETFCPRSPPPPSRFTAPRIGTSAPTMVGISANTSPAHCTSNFLERSHPRCRIGCARRAARVPHRYVDPQRTSNEYSPRCCSPISSLSTACAAEMGYACWLERLDRHNHVVARQLQRFSGRCVKNTGDGILANVDGPGRAIRCLLSPSGTACGASGSRAEPVSTPAR